MATFKDKLDKAVRIRAMLDQPVTLGPNAQSAEPLKKEAAKQLITALNDIKSAKDASGKLHLDALASQITKDYRGLRLFEDNGMEVCLLSSGDLADTPIPFRYDSILTPREPEYIVLNYNAKDCEKELHKAIDSLVAHALHVVNGARTIGNHEPLNSNQI